ncbi:MAG: ABC transporter ATP-binding protein [Deltaproteobacteria bacterium]|nr:MAG: ABC transporter ATP-binding protein [Deltaproteobacteria bacterium]
MGILEVKNLSLSFGGIVALNGIDLSVRENEILSIIGPNGSGKTTLFNCLTGIYRPDRGEMIYKGESLLGRSPDAIAVCGIARTFQNLRLFMNMNVLDNLMLGRHVHMKKKFLAVLLRLRKEEILHRRKVEEIIDFLDLQAYRKSRVADCPYGVQKRIELGRALALEPKLLLLDEPISGLTSEEKEESAYRVTEIRGRFKVTILLVEHDLKIASRLADSMVAFNYGQKIAEGTPEEVQRNPEVIRAYVGEE